MTQPATRPENIAAHLADYTQVPFKPSPVSDAHWSTLRRTDGRRPSSWNITRYLTALQLVGCAVAKYTRKSDRVTCYLVGVPVAEEGWGNFLVRTFENSRAWDLGPLLRGCAAVKFDLAEAVATYTGVPSLQTTERVRERQLRTAERRMTCPCCLGDFKTVEVRDHAGTRTPSYGTMVHHGYTRPGDGYQTESCVGARHCVPLEVEKDGLLFMVSDLRGRLAVAEHELTALQQCYSRAHEAAARAVGTSAHVDELRAKVDAKRRVEAQESLTRQLQRTREFYEQVCAKWQPTHRRRIDLSMNADGHAYEPIPGAEDAEWVEMVRTR